MQITVDENITLKTWEEKDAPKLFSLVDRNRARLQRWLPWVPHVKAEKDSLEFITNSSKDASSEKGVELGIWFDDQLVGCMGLHANDLANKKTSVGYWLSAEFEGQGVVSKSVRRLVDFCFSDLGMNRVELRAAVENTASRAVAERVGFVFEGICRESELIDGRFIDHAVYSVLKRELNFDHGSRQK